MLRSILLLATIAVAAGVYIEKRDSRVPGGRTRSGDIATDPAIAASNSASPRTATTGSPHPMPSGSVSSEPLGDPLSAMDREMLRDALEDWDPVPRELLETTHDLEGMQEIARAAFRSLLLNASRSRYGARPETLEVSRVSFRDGRMFLLEGVRREGAHLLGNSPEGLALTVPASAIADVAKLTPEAARTSWRERIERRIEVLEEADDPAELTTALELLLWIDDFTRAETLYPKWLSAGGASVIALEVTDPTLRVRYQALARALDSRAGTPIVTPTVDTPTIQRTLEQLRAFLSSRSDLRLLSEKQRLERVEECDAWADWLTRRGATVGIAPAERESLDHELSLLRYDLLKGSGF